MKRGFGASGQDSVSERRNQIGFLLLGEKIIPMYKLTSEDRFSVYRCDKIGIALLH